ncbi:MAG: GNAT family N-acetyltransferase [Gemmatimonadaceae bacterium]
MNVLETERTLLRRLEPSDAEFILGLLNEPSFLHYIGDKGVRTLDDARAYIENVPLTSYARFGFGLYLTTLKDGTPIGICGLVKRDALTDVDVGFAFLPAYWGHGYALESALAVLEHGKRDHGLTRIVAIANADNESSIRLLERLGLTFERAVRLTEGSSEVSLFGRVL